MFEKRVVIDARGHLLGRLASVVAKELLNGQRIVVVRCEEINISGSLYRNKLTYHEFLNKRTNSNPRHGPFHQRAPSKILWRTIRGMLHQKTARGQEAMKRLSTFDGIPEPYDKQKRVVVPAALRVMRLKTGRDYTVIGTLADSVGWKHKDLLARLEAKRKAEGKEFYEQKKAKSALRKKAEEACAGELAKVNSVLAEYGY
mmetsp:Transcript_139916/g.198174  ORF Transcript_139916/g.198174 Transcript_139916/m.198174 type:complete len:201 (-) Transcript_139916:58-660(-)